MTSVNVWDPFVRFFHWATAILFLANLTIFDEDSLARNTVGYILFALVLARLVWGLVGTKHARFRAFWPSASQITQHVKGLVSGKTEIHLSHNSLGALMVYILLLTLVLIGLTGIMLADGGFAKTEWLEEAHEVLSNYALICVGLHILGVLWEERRTKVNLLRAMITGRKIVPDDGP